MAQSERAKDDPIRMAREHKESYGDGMGIFADYGEHKADSEYNRQQEIEHCGHIAIVSINDTECQCMDCLKVWTKSNDFVSDYPIFDRG